MNLFSDSRRGIPTTKSSDDHRSAYEHDFDRLLFSTPVRRLSDKTQVWPLDKNDGVRTRLTHSHEVSNIARSIGKRLAKNGVFSDYPDYNDVILPILGAIGLAHDLGNPPFGHQGEAAIGRWFKSNRWVFDTQERDKPDRLEEPVAALHHDEFIEFEGNAQTIRLVSTLQVSPGRNGLDLTAATIAALMKYTGLCSDRVAKESPNFNCSLKKYGYFLSEEDLIGWVRDQTGLGKGERHPLTWIMEAADDIAYSVLDIEDGMKKCVFSPDDLLSDFTHRFKEKRPDIVASIKSKFEVAESSARSIHDKRDIKSSYLRTVFIKELIDSAYNAFRDGYEDIISMKRKSGLLDDSNVCNYLKDFATSYVFKSRPVLSIESEGARYIYGLMDFFWDSISSRKSFGEIDSRRTSAVAAYGWSLISDNYVRAACDAVDAGLPVRYCELRLLTDMMAGMTDGFARDLFHDLQRDGHV